MIQGIIVNKEQKIEIKQAATACNLSVSSFMKLAAKEKINRMGIQINTSQGTNLDSPASNDLVKDGGANARIQSNI